MATGKIHVMGIDFGSTTAKTVILDGNGALVAWSVSHKGSVSDEGAQASIAEALARAGLKQSDITRTVATGYGRRMLDVADKSYTEITCHARGAVSMVPHARLVIDIGGQDSKVIAVDPQGLVSQFAMNDRCAAGTGKFFEALARAVQVPLEDMGPMALDARENIVISSMCATFAETEVISLLAEGKSKPEVLGAVHAAVASRTVGLVARVGKRDPIVMTGGVARNVAAVHYIEQALGTTLIIPPTPQIAGALGAALIALDEIEITVGNADEDDRVDGAVAAARACGTPACKTPPATSAVPAGTVPLHGPIRAVPPVPTSI